MFKNFLLSPPNCDFWEIFNAKDGSISAKQNGMLLHSAYSPEKEARQLVLKSNFDSCKAGVFYGIGLGYGPIEYAKEFTERTLIIIEPDEKYFFASLSFLDWEKVFSLKSCVLAISAPCQTVISLIERIGFSYCAFFSNDVQTSHAKEYFSSIKTLSQRNISKDKINEATSKKFSKLWVRNSCKNLFKYSQCDGVSIYKDNAKNLPVTILASGPSLQNILPYLSEIKKRSIVVCVDSALRACLKIGIEPDFIIIGDPQYYAYLHIADCTSKTSTLIAEPAVYPSVYRFPCKKIVITSSLFPMGAWFEKKFGERGNLGAGGSVSANAWNFAYFIGSREIYFAGLDLAYPKNNTHIKGATFENVELAKSTRCNTVESKNILQYISAGKEYGTDYDGKEVLTDSRMKLFAWYFESRIASLPDSNTFSFSSKSLAIPGLSVKDVHSFLEKNIIEDAKKDFFKKSESVSNKIPTETLETLYNQFKTELNNLLENAKTGILLCDDALKKQSVPPSTFEKLSKIDNAILSSSSKESAALVFPTKETLLKNVPTSSDSIKASLLQSRFIYSRLYESVEIYLRYL